MFTLTNLTLFLKSVLPFLLKIAKKQWKIILGFLIGLLVSGYLAQPVEPVKEEVKTVKTVIDTDVKKKKQVKKKKVKTKVKEVFRPDGTLLSKETENSEETEDTKENEDKIKKEKKDLKDHKKETPIKPYKNRLALIGVDYTFYNKTSDFSLDFETFRFGPSSIFVGASVPLRMVGEDESRLKLITVKASVSFPTPF